MRSMELEHSEQEVQEWVHVGYFGNSKIMANGDKRKLVEEGYPDFDYTVEDFKQEVVSEELSEENI